MWLISAHAGKVFLWIRRVEKWSWDLSPYVPCTPWPAVSERCTTLWSILILPACSGSERDLQWPRGTLVCVQHWHDCGDAHGAQGHATASAGITVCWHPGGLGYYHSGVRRCWRGRLIQRNWNIFSVFHWLCNLHPMQPKRLSISGPHIYLWHRPCEVKLAISHHSLNAERDQLTSEKPLVFVLDPPKDDEDGGDGKKAKKAKKRKNKQTVTPNSFGSGLCINKFKASTTFVIGYRCRLEWNQSLIDFLCTYWK